MFKRAASVLTSVATITSLSGFAALAPIAAVAAVPADFGLKEGDTISAAGSDDPDVYIVNEHGFKRLFLNPVIFGFYGHLGGFAKVKNVSAPTRDAFPTSGLFRNCETNEQKVWAVEVTGEDTGTLHHVNMSGDAAVSQDANFFKKVFCINNNEANWYSKSSADYTSLSQIPVYSRQPGKTPTPTPVPGNVSVSLAASNPSARTITLNAYGETVLALNFSGSGKVQELTFKRGGAGATGDFDNLYIYDGARRLTGGRTPSSSDGTVTFINLGVDVNGSKELKLVADYSATAGNVNYWDLTSIVLASGTTSGVPLRSNNFTHSGANGGTLNVDKTGSVANPKVGQQNAQLSEFKITANTEAAFIRRVQLLNGGSVAATGIANVRLEVNNVKVADGVMTGDNYAVFDFGAPGFKIEKGDNKIFKLFGNIAGKKDETIKFYPEVASDVTAIGDQFGFGMKPTIDTAFDTAAEAHQLTLQGGVLTIAFNGPNASNVGTDTSDTVLARYSMSAANDIEVKKMGIVICWDDAGDGTFNNAHDTTNGVADLDDIKVTDEGTGQVLVGPADGSAFTTNEATGCPDAKTGASKIFTDTFDLKSGQTRNLKVTADIKTANSRSGTALTTGDIVRIVLDGYGESDLSGTSGDVAVLKYSGTNTAVDDADIVPNTDLSANNQTVQAASLLLSLSSTPGDVTYVKGTSNIDAVGVNFAASLASALKVTDVTLTGYVADSGATHAKGVGADPDGSLTVSGLVSAVKLYDGDTGTLISETPQANNLNNTTGTIKFTNLNWNIPAGQTKKLLVRANLSSNSTSGSSDVFAFDVAATTDITALDEGSKTVNADNSAVNGTTTPTNVVTVANAGSLNVAKAPSDPIVKATYWGQNDALFTVYRIRSTDEAFLLETLNIITATTSSGTETAASATANVDVVKLKYKNKAGSTLTATGSLNSAGSVSFGFTGDNRPYVPKDSSMDVEVYANIKPKAGRTGTALSTLGSEEAFSLDFSSGAANEFRAVGEGSGTVIDASDGNIANIARGNDHYVFRVYPEFVKESFAGEGSETIGTREVLRFTIKAHGMSDAKLLFDDPTSTTLRFELVASGSVTTSNMTATLYDYSTSEVLASVTISSGQIPGVKASANFSDWERDFEITGGTSKTFRIDVGFVNFLDKSDYFQLVLNDIDGNTVVKYVDGAKSDESNEVTLISGIWRSLPMNGSIFVKQ